MAIRNSEEFLEYLNAALAKYGVRGTHMRHRSPMKGSTAFMPLRQPRKEEQPEQEVREETEVSEL